MDPFTGKHDLLCQNEIVTDLIEGASRYRSTPSAAPLINAASHGDPRTGASRYSSGAASPANPPQPPNRVKIIPVVRTHIFFSILSN